MTTMIGTETGPSKVVEQLSACEYDVVEAYRTAIVRLGERAETAMLSSFEQEHREQIRNLDDLTKGMGGSKRRAGHWYRLFTRSRIVVAGLVGDLPVLAAITHNELNLLNAYERAVDHKKMPQRVLAVLQQHRNGSRRRYEWLVARLSALTS